MTRLNRLLLLLLIVAVGVAVFVHIRRQPPVQGPVEAYPYPPLNDQAAILPAIRAVLPNGSLKEGVYTIYKRRDDLRVRYNKMPVAPAAGLECDVRFYLCACGSPVALGKLCILSSQLERVSAVFAQNPMLKITTIGPLLLGAEPAIMLVHFQGEGSATELATSVRNVLDAAMTPPPSTAPATRSAVGPG